MSKVKRVPDILKEAAATFEERNKLYGDNYKNFGPALLNCFGGKLPPIDTAEKANQLFLLVQCLGKLTRYCQNIETGGHQDSARDLSVYAAMLEEMTNERPAK